jgi:hypothetical protein
MKSGIADGEAQSEGSPLRAGSEAVMGLGDKVGLRPAVSTAQRWAAFQDFVAQGGQLPPIG